MGPDSRWLFKILSFLTHCGIQVEIGPLDDCTKPNWTAGRTWYEPVARVWIAHPEARGALLTAAHEAGHMLSYWRLRDRPGPVPGPEKREHLAYLYGWVVLRWLGIPITKGEWRAFNEE